MTAHQAKELVAAIAAWLRFERLCSPRVEWQWERVVYEPLRRYLTANGYPYVPGEWTSEREESRRGKFRFDYRYGCGKDQPVGVIEVKASNAHWAGMVGDIAKLLVLGDGQRHLLLLGPGQPDVKRLSEVLSFDIARPSIGVSGNTESRVWQTYYNDWTEYRKKKKDRGEGKGHTPNITTTLEGITSEESTLFVAMWGIASSVGRRAPRTQVQTPASPASGSNGDRR